MIYFTAEDVFRSILCSIIYGICYAFLLTFFEVIICEKRGLNQYINSIFKYEKLSKIERPDTTPSNYILQNRIILSFSIFLFFAGYLLLSYFTLDGALRMYVLIIAISLTYFIRQTLGKYIITITSKLIRTILYPVIVLLRIIMILLHRMRVLYVTCKPKNK